MLFPPLPNPQFPAVVHTTRRVMLMEFVDGVRINDVEGLRRLGLPAADVSRLLAECYSDQIFRHGFVHCDPHPGNVLVRTAADGRCDQTRISLMGSFCLGRFWCFSPSVVSYL